MNGDVPTGVSRTAVGVAWMRAEESRRPDPLFVDPLAAAFVAGARAAIEGRSGNPERLRIVDALFYVNVVIRTKFYDDYLLAAAAAGCHQVVLPAAGLDTRAYRLDWPAGVRLFELDLPALLAYKEKVLATQGAATRCERRVIAVDLREDWPAELLAAGFDPARPTAWLVEGLLIYLTASDTAKLLTTIGELSAPGSQLSCEHRDNTDNSLVTRVRATSELDDLTAMWQGGLGEDVAEWLGRNGWTVHMFEGSALAESYGRPDPEAASVNFLTAVRKGPPGPT
jgi:methyltransferase (TIGR00027 family)